ncbi:MAG: pilus assembly protein [Rhizobiaceae bacterium]|nr:pilus assembly protein [Rhizobiaceae bacterium]
MLKGGRTDPNFCERSFHADTRGIAAVEFGLLLPVLLLLLGGAVEFSGAVTAGSRATRVAETIGQVVAQTQAALTTEDLTAIIKSAAIVDPDIIVYAKETGKSLETAVDVTVSSIAFNPLPATCTTNCTYEASVVFSEALSGPKRPCGKQSGGAASSPTTLPTNVFSANSILVVDVEVFYKPLMSTFLGTEISFKRSLFFRPRYVDQINYSKNCPGFPVV